MASSRTCGADFEARDRDLRGVLSLDLLDGRRILGVLAAAPSAAAWTFGHDKDEVREIGLAGELGRLGENRREEDDEPEE